MKRMSWIVTLTLCITLQVGCSAIPSKIKSFVSRTSDPNDPLASISGDASPGYKSAKRGLDKGEETLLKFARWREDMGDHVEAKQQYQNILAENPECVDARLGIARVEFATGRVAEAVDILQATARKYPDRADTWKELGRIQSERQEWGPAVQSLTKAVDMDGENQAARYQLGVALARSDRLQDAIPHLAFAVGESAALYNIGFVLHDSGRDEEAAHWFRRALNSHPDQRTKTSATKMLAQLSGELPDNARNREASRVDVALTSYEAYREVPARRIQAAANESTTASYSIPRPENSATITPQSPGQSVPQGYPQNAVPQTYPQGNSSNGSIAQWPGPSASPPGNASMLPARSVEPQPWRGPSQ